VTDPEHGPAAANLAELVVDQAPEALVFADCEGVIRLWNAAAERVFGHSAAEALGRPLDIIIPERFRDAHDRGFRAAVESGSTKYAGRTMTTRGLHKDGDRALYVELGFSLVKDASGTVLGALASARDCTERYLAERAQRQKT